MNTTNSIVKSLREALGESRPQFAARLGYSIRALKDWEQGNRSPSTAVLPKLIALAEQENLPESARIFNLILSKKPKTGGKVFTKKPALPDPSSSTNRTRSDDLFEDVLVNLDLMMQFLFANAVDPESFQAVLPQIQRCYGIKESIHRLKLSLPRRGRPPKI